MSPALHSAHLVLLNGQTRLPTAARVFVMAAVLVTKWDRRYRTRKALKDLEPHVLYDIGLSQSRASAEANKRFWQG